MDDYADGCPQDNSSTQGTDFGLRAVKIDGRTESRAREKMSHECMAHSYVGEYH